MAACQVDAVDDAFLKTGRTEGNKSNHIKALRSLIYRMNSPGVFFLQFFLLLVRSVCAHCCDKPWAISTAFTNVPFWINGFNQDQSLTLNYWVLLESHKNRDLILRCAF